MYPTRLREDALLHTQLERQRLDQSLRGSLHDDGRILLCLHRWGDHGHPTLRAPTTQPGNGLILFFRVTDFRDTLGRARSMVPKLAEEPTDNPGTGTPEFALLDPDGYYVMVSALGEDEQEP